MIDPLDVWKAKLINLPKATDDSWALAFAEWYAGRVVKIEPDPTKLTLVSPVPVGFTFTFDVAAFANALKSLKATTNAVQAAKDYAEAWGKGIAGVTFPATLNVQPGAFVPPSTPATLFSAVASVALNPASVAAAKTKLLDIAKAKTVPPASDSMFPQIFREATLLLKIDVNGTNSVAPTPAPLAALLVPLI